MGGRRPVVFDLDGILIDSEDLSWEAWRRLLRRYDVEITDGDIAVLTGRTEHDAHRRFSQVAALPSFEEFWSDLSEVTFRLFDERLEAYGDAVDVLDHLISRGHLVAVASSSPRERVDRSLRAVGLAERFQTVVAGDEVSAGKPDPEIFVAAAQGLGVDPASCVAVEDSPAGIAAARAAGMWVVAVERGAFPHDELRAAHVVVPRLTPAVFLE